MSRGKAIVLAIETSCDETAVSILRADREDYSILADIVSSQVQLHAKWGGVVPNLAAREHVKNLPGVLTRALGEAHIMPAEIDVIAVTSGPGLIPALMAGTSLAKTLAYVWNKPLLGIHHIEGHIYANFIFDKIGGISNFKFQISNLSGIRFPILCLVVSGGHTQLVLMKNHLQYEIVGQTLDDAAGEAFDKVARILGIGYPGGPSVARWASKFQDTRYKKQTISNNQKTTFKPESGYGLRITDYGISFPRPMLNRNNFDFSFSGLKTAVLYETKKHSELMKDTKYVAQVCHEFQQAVVDVLVGKTMKAVEKFKPKTVMLAGGVSANKELREQLGNAISNYNQSHRSNLSYSTPSLPLTGDNAAMIAAAAAVRWRKMSAAQKKKALDGWKTVQPDANMELK